MADTLFVDTFFLVYPQEGVMVSITPELPEQYQVRFRLVGKITGGGAFKVELVYPQDGFPHLTGREQKRLTQTLHAGAETVYEGRVTGITLAMLQLDDVPNLPRRALRVAPGS